MLYQKEISDTVLIQLIELFALNKAKKPMSHNSLITVVLDNCNINYADFLVALDNLVKTRHVKKFRSIIGITMYRILEKGRHAIEFFAGNIPVYIREPIEESVAEVLKSEHDIKRISGGMVPSNNGDDYCAHCVLTDYDDTVLMDLKFYAGTSEQAAKLYESFKENPQAVYEACVRAFAGKAEK